MRNYAENRRKGVGVLGVMALLFFTAQSGFADFDSEYFSYNQQYDHWVIQADLPLREEATLDEVLLVDVEETRPLSVISVPVPPPGVIILTCCGACIVKWLRNRGQMSNV